MFGDVGFVAFEIQSQRCALSTRARKPQHNARVIGKANAYTLIGADAAIDRNSIENSPYRLATGSKLYVSARE